jgi:DNA-directed RNA polymerase specialized sigma24 family protein
VLEQFDTCGETTDEEIQEADRAQARLARLGDDAELFERLAASGFSGPEYELFRAELAAYALPVMRSFIRRKTIYPMCRRARRPVAATDAIREHLAHDVDDRLELALETIASGLRLFERYALRGRRWSPERGASLKTFFVGACVRTFSAAIRCWVAERDPPGVRVLPMDTVPNCGAHDDPAEDVVSMQQVNDHLNGMKPLARDLAARVTLFDETFEEAGQAHGLSARAVEGHLYRHRKEAQRRGKTKRGGA